MGSLEKTQGNCGSRRFLICLLSVFTRLVSVVTVNSTLGASSLMRGCPTIALSNPIYNLPGLTFQGPLDAFWRDGTAPDAELFRRFRNTVIHATQINGGFYSSEGIAMAASNSRRMLEAARSPLETLL